MFIPTFFSVICLVALCSTAPVLDDNESNEREYHIPDLIQQWPTNYSSSSLESEEVPKTPSTNALRGKRAIYSYMTPDNEIQDDELVEFVPLSHQEETQVVKVEEHPEGEKKVSEEHTNVEEVFDNFFNSWNRILDDIGVQYQEEIPKTEKEEPVQKDVEENSVFDDHDIVHKFIFWGAKDSSEKENSVPEEPKIIEPIPADHEVLIRSQSFGGMTSDESEKLTPTEIHSGEQDRKTSFFSVDDESTPSNIQEKATREQAIIDWLTMDHSQNQDQALQAAFIWFQSLDVPLMRETLHEIEEDRNDSFDAALEKLFILHHGDNPDYSKYQKSLLSEQDQFGSLETVIKQLVHQEILNNLELKSVSENDSLETYIRRLIQREEIKNMKSSDDLQKFGKSNGVDDADGLTMAVHIQVGKDNMPKSNNGIQYSTVVVVRGGDKKEETHVLPKILEPSSDDINPWQREPRSV